MAGWVKTVRKSDWIETEVTTEYRYQCSVESGLHCLYVSKKNTDALWHFGMGNRDNGRIFDTLDLTDEQKKVVLSIPARMYTSADHYRIKTWIHTNDMSALKNWYYQ